MLCIIVHKRGAILPSVWLCNTYRGKGQVASIMLYRVIFVYTVPELCYIFLNILEHYSFISICPNLCCYVFALLCYIWIPALLNVPHWAGLFSNICLTVSLLADSDILYISVEEEIAGLDIVLNVEKRAKPMLFFIFLHYKHSYSNSLLLQNISAL